MLAKKAVETFLRFPLPIISSFAATIFLICLSHECFADGKNQLMERLAMSSFLCMLLSISVSLFIERNTIKKGQQLAAFALTVVLAILYFLSLPSPIDGVSGVRFALLVIALHLLVSFAPFIVHSEMNGLWQYNKSLFIRILTGGIYSAVLFGGLALALLAVKNLFDVPVQDEYFFDLWLVVAGVFNTWFFLSGVPEKLSDLEHTTDYPKGLKVFTLNVLVPLITVYLVILYLYAGKILITSDWPVGWVAHMVIAFSIFGILSFLLIYPLRNDEATPWVKFYSGLFYYLLIPPILLLYVSIFKRINMYGVTVERYFVVVLAVWLSFIALYSILTSGKKIRTIPLSLCVIALLVSFGPWGAFAVSRNSQVSELTVLLESYGVLENGKVDTANTYEIKSQDYDRVISIIDYINTMHGAEPLQTFFHQDISAAIKQDSVDAASRRGRETVLLEMMNLTKVNSEDEKSYLNFGTKDEVMLNSDGYTFVKNFSRFSFYRDEDSKIDFLIESDTVHFVRSTTTGDISLSYRDFEPLVFDMKEFFSTLPRNENFEMNPAQLTIESENKDWQARIVFSSLDIVRENGKFELEDAAGVLMLNLEAESVSAGTP